MSTVAPTSATPTAPSSNSTSESAPQPTPKPARLHNPIQLVDEAQAKTNLLGMTPAQLGDYFKMDLSARRD